MIRKFLKELVTKILTLEAVWVLKKFNPKIVSITGSVGKTSTKDALTLVFESFKNTRGSLKSFNAEFGIPLTILGLPNAWNSPLRWLSNLIRGFFVYLGSSYPEWLILEVGAHKPGDIKKFSTLFKSDVVVLTKFPKVPVHVEFFSSPEEVKKDKLFLLNSLKNDGLAVLNFDDKAVLAAREMIETEVITYGFDAGSDISAKELQILYKDQRPTGIKFKVVTKNEEAQVELKGVLGRGYVYNILAALGASKKIGHTLKERAEKIENFKGVKGRMRIVPGLKNSTIIDDSYNSSPVASRQALKTLDEILSKGRKIAVLGDMAELGEYTRREHKKIGGQAAKVADLIITCGRDARDIAAGALESGFDESNVLQYDDPRRAGKELELKLSEGDVVLVKGSQRVRMEKTVLEIMEKPEEAPLALVRQEKDWLKR